MNQMEERAIRLISENYPITLEELAKLMKISYRRAELLIKRLEFHGYVITEPLPDKVYLRLKNAPMGR
jgi:DNA-binding MarR family transcriptional regulator